MGKQGGRQKPAGVREGTEGPGWPALPCTAKCPEQSSKGPHTWAHVRWASPLAPRGRPAWPRRQPPLPLSSTSSLSSLRPSRVWDSRALTPNRDWATKAPSGRLRGSQPGPEEGQAPEDSRSSQPLPTSSLPSLGPGSWNVWEEPPRQTTGVCRWEVGPQNELLSLLLCCQPGALAFLLG